MVVRLRGVHLRAARYGGQVAATARHLAVARADPRAEADEGARLGIDAGQRCRASAKHANAYAISDLTFQ